VVYGHPLEIFNLDRTGAVPPPKGFPARHHLKFLRTRSASHLAADGFGDPANRPLIQTSHGDVQVKGVVLG
jgi:hypothetical protein